MNRIQPLVFAILLLWTPGQLWAGVFSRDWKTPGDGLLTYDDVNQREWLDLSQALLDQFPGATQQMQYQNARAELGAGGIFDGFIHAKTSDAIAFAQSAGIVTSTLDFSINYPPTRSLIDFVSPTASFPGDKAFSQFVMDDMSAAGLRAQFFTNPSSGSNGLAGFASSNSLDAVGPFALVLFRQEVPESSTLVLTLLFTILGTGIRYRSYRRCLP